MSGRSCCVPVHYRDMHIKTSAIVRECCERLAIPYTGNEELIHESQTVPGTAPLTDWCGAHWYFKADGEFVDCQLLVSQQPQL
eukprot:4575858-Amphidinium_carterae.1